MKIKHHLHHAQSTLPVIIGISFLVVLSLFLALSKKSPPSKTISTPNDLTIPESIIIQKSSSKDHVFENTTNTFHTYFKDNYFNESSITFQKDTSKISFYTPLQQSFGVLNSSSAQAEKNIVLYSQVFQDTDLKYTLSSKRLLEEFIISTQPTALKLTQISQIAKTENIDHYEKSRDGSIHFFSQGQIKFTLPKPVLYEMSNQENKNYGIEYQIIDSSPNTYQINKIITPEGQQWLANLNRNYPIAIDLVIDNADTVGNWVTSDSVNTPISQDTAITHGGTGSVKISTSGYLGTGADGACTVSANTNINTGTCVSRANGDAVMFSSTVNTAVGSTAITVSATPTGLAAGDEVLIINLQGTTSNYADVGEYDTRYITSISTNTLYLDHGLTNGYDGTTQKIVVQRIPQYTTVTVNSGINFYPSTWNGTTGGVIFFRANNTVTATGTIHANYIGYRNGAGGSGSGGGTGGESFCAAVGSAGGNGGSYTVRNGADGNCGGGGGAGLNNALNGTAGVGSTLGGAGGGGGGGFASDDAGGGAGGAGGYGTGGEGGKYTYIGAGTSGSDTSSGSGGVGGNDGWRPTAGSGGGGGTYGDASLSKLYFGAGGAGGGGGELNGGTNLAGGNGGSGAGIVVVSGNSVTVTGGIRSVGATGRAGTENGAGAGGGGGGGGGGSGGSIKLYATSLTLGTNLVLGNGGTGGQNGFLGDGGNGGKGRIRAEYTSSISGSSNPTYSAETIPLSLNDTITKTTAPINLAYAVRITFWVRSTVTGQHLRFQFGESASNEQTYNITVNSANTWEQKTWDISSISSTSKDAVTQFAFAATDTTRSMSFYFDDIEYEYLYPPGNCLIGETTADTPLYVNWLDTNTVEDGYEVQRSVDGGAYGTLISLGAGITGYSDSTTTSGHTYQYRILPYFTGPIYGEACYTALLNFQSSSFQLNGLQIEGLQIN
jgi:hypothetical protein